MNAGVLCDAIDDGEREASRQHPKRTLQWVMFNAHESKR
ncbi:Uncharacterised protein [Vibrio cholerae]|nr:Uncharacterised protein [Vibrio cholerae]CSC56430.1 Uncharacterised protein [Vibrio cholerae]CSI82336.1 Uncharacterised protein [Vibrio cholerae]